MNKIYECLAKLASINYQIRFIINGTIDNYVLPEELIEDFISRTNTILNNQIMTGGFSHKTLQDLNEINLEIKKFSKSIGFNNSDVSNKEIIFTNSNWNKIREISNDFLKKNNFDLDLWENKNIN